MELVKGQRTRVDALTASTALGIDVALDGPATHDLGLFGLGADGRLIADEWMIFYNQPTSPGGAATLSPRSDGGSLTIDLAAVPPEVDRLVLTAAVDGDATMAALRSGTVTISAAGAEVARHRTSGADFGAERAVMLLELYRKDGWRLTVVGQGFEGGLAALVEHFGGTVDDEPPAPAPASASVPASAPEPGDAASPHVASPDVATPPVDLGKITLDKGTVSLAKDQTVSLEKGGAPVLTKVAMGLGWDPTRAGTSIDLDASCITFDAAGELVDMVWFVKKSGADGAIVHSGDNLTGEGEGDDEVIVVDLAAVPASRQVLLFTVTSYKGHPFTDVTNAYCRLIDVGTDAELVRFELTGSEPSTGVYMAALARDGAGWAMTAIGVFRDGKTVRNMIRPASGILSRLGGA